MHLFVKKDLQNLKIRLQIDAKSTFVLKVNLNSKFLEPNQIP